MIYDISLKQKEITMISAETVNSLYQQSQKDIVTITDQFIISPDKPNWKIKEKLDHSHYQIIKPSHYPSLHKVTKQNFTSFQTIKQKDESQNNTTSILKDDSFIFKQFDPELQYSSRVINHQQKINNQIMRVHIANFKADLNKSYVNKSLSNSRKNELSLERSRILRKLDQSLDGLYPYRYYKQNKGQQIQYHKRQSTRDKKLKIMNGLINKLEETKRKSKESIRYSDIPAPNSQKGGHHKIKHELVSALKKSIISKQSPISYLQPPVQQIKITQIQSQLKNDTSNNSQSYVIESHVIRPAHQFYNESDNFIAPNIILSKHKCFPPADSINSAQTFTFADINGTSLDNQKNIEEKQQHQKKQSLMVQQQYQSDEQKCQLCRIIGKKCSFH